MKSCSRKLFFQFILFPACDFTNELSSLYRPTLKKIYKY